MVIAVCAIISSSWTDQSSKNFASDAALLHKDAQSAIQRAKSPECQALIRGTFDKSCEINLAKVEIFIFCVCISRYLIMKSN